MQFQVPQFIETEDKIVGPFTIRQFIYVGIGGGMSAMLYFTVATWLWFFASIIIFGAAIALAFVKIEGRPLFNVVTSALGYYWKPQTYLWKSEGGEKVATTMTMSHDHEGGGGISLENILGGMALHKRWEQLQTAEKMPAAKAVDHAMASKYQIFRNVTGERRAAKRIDYR